MLSTTTFKYPNGSTNQLYSSLPRHEQRSGVVEDPDELEVTTIRLADLIKKCYEVRIDWLGHIETVKLK